MTATRLALAAALLLPTTACKRDGYVQESLDAFARHGKEIKAKIADASDKKAGVAEAQKYLDANKDDIAGRMKELGGLKGFQVSEDMQAKLGAGIVEASFMCTKLQADFMLQAAEDADFDAALDKLCASWDAAVRT